LIQDFTHPATEHGDQNSSQTLLPHIWLTLKRFLVGFFVAVFLGTVSGFFLGVSKTLHEVGKPIVNVLRSLPSAAIWPVCAAILGYGLRSQMFVIIFGAAWPTLISTMRGTMSLHPEVYDTLRFMKMETYRRWWILFLWSLPDILTGIEISCAIAFLLTVTVEYFWPALGGLGWYLNYYTLNGIEMNHELAALFIIGLLGWGFNTLVHVGRTKLIFWQGELRDIIRQETPERGKRMLNKIKDERKRNILTSDYVMKCWLIALLLVCGKLGFAETKYFPKVAFDPNQQTESFSDETRRKVLQALTQGNRDEILKSLISNRVVEIAGETWFNLSGIEINNGDLAKGANVSRICWDHARFVDVDLSLD
jgi:sulfonate transport system permease protein